MRHCASNGIVPVENKEVYIRICNLSHEQRQVERKLIMAVLETLVQPPVDVFRPEGKDARKQALRKGGKEVQ